MTLEEARAIVDRMNNDVKSRFKGDSAFEHSYLLGGLSEKFAWMLCNTDLKPEHFDKNGSYNPPKKK